MISIEKNKLDLLVKLYKKVNIKDFDKQKIRKLQYLTKNYKSEDKQKIYGIINIYQKTKNIYLRTYLEDIYNELIVLED